MYDLALQADSVSFDDGHLHFQLGYTGTPFLSRSLRTKYGSGYQLELFCEDGRSVSKTQDDVGDDGFLCFAF